ncbi:unnamed protein product, partial [Ixodes hexagonus]
ILCTYNRTHANWKSGNTSFNLEAFPYQFCTSVVYCCVNMDINFDIDPQVYEPDVKSLKRAKKMHPGLKTFVVLGDSYAQNAIFEASTANLLHQEMFVHAVVTWLLKRSFDGIYIYWTYANLRDLERLVRTTGYVGHFLSKSNLQFGLILPSDEEFLRGIDVPGFARRLKDVPAGILLAPSEQIRGEHTKTDLNRADDLLKWLTRLQDAFTKVSSTICPMVPFAALSFKLQAFIEDGNVVLKPVDKGEPGAMSGEAGRLTYFEVCQQPVNGNHFKFPTRDSVMVGDEYITYLTPRALQNLLGSAGVRRPFECLGAWEPEWDDFGGVCKSGKHPLLQTMYRFLSSRSPKL